MKKQILITLTIALAIFSCKKEDLTIPDGNDKLLIGKWYLDSTLTPDFGSVKWGNRNCGDSISFGYLLFSEKNLTDFTCINGNEFVFENSYKTNLGLITTDAGSVRYSLNGGKLLICDPYEVTDEVNDTIYSWYSR